MAAAVIAANVIALVITVVFARILGATGYGSLAALMSAFIILMVPGSALQIAVAREVSPPRDGTWARRCRPWLARLAVGHARRGSARGAAARPDRGRDRGGRRALGRRRRAR